MSSDCKNIVIKNKCDIFQKNIRRVNCGDCDFYEPGDIEDEDFEDY